MTATVVSAEAAKAQGGANEDTLDTIAGLGRRALTELDTLVGSLRAEGSPPMMAASPRLADLPALMEPLRSSGVAADLTTVVTGPLNDSTQLAIYRIVQEATTNILKHAQATAVRVDVVEAAGHVSVRVSDGCGSLEPADSSERVGRRLIGIEERVQGLGGSWSYDTTNGDGTTITAILPVGGVV